MASYPRPIDHLVMPTASLEAARERLGALGFTVAPEGRHPFGTANCCVYFADDTFLEPLAVAESAKITAAARKGNVFVARDAAYRYRVGEEGFSALVMGTRDAAADHASFVGSGLSAGRRLGFSRAFVDASGARGRASFKLAFASDLRAPDSFFFTCERAGVPKVDRAALQRHANGVAGIKSVVLSADEPPAFVELLERVTGAKPVQSSQDRVLFQAPNGAVEIVTPALLEERFGIAGEPDRGLRLCAVLFSVMSTTPVERLLNTAGIASGKQRHRVVVAPAPGQGAAFAFEGP